MKVLLSLFLCSIFVSYAHTEELKQKIDALVEKLPATEIDFETTWFVDSPVKRLLDFGKEGIPFLIPHLTDTRITKSYLMKDSYPRRSSKFFDSNNVPLAVNQIVGYIITQSANYHFYIKSGDNTICVLGLEPLTDPFLIKAYQDQINQWYLLYANLNDIVKFRQYIDDGCHLNRFEAYSFFEKTGNPEGRNGLIARIQTLLTSPCNNSLTDSEMVSCAAGLGSIGDTNDIPLLKSIWMQLFEPERFQSGSDTVSEIFSLSQSRIKLGDKKQVVKDLDLFEDTNISKLRDEARSEFHTTRAKMQLE